MKTFLATKKVNRITELLQIDWDNIIKFIKTIDIAASSQSDRVLTQGFHQTDITVIPEYNNPVLHKIKSQTKDRKGAVW